MVKAKPQPASAAQPAASQPEPAATTGQVVQLSPQMLAAFQVWKFGFDKREVMPMPTAFVVRWIDWFSCMGYRLNDRLNDRLIDWLLFESSI